MDDLIRFCKLSDSELMYWKYYLSLEEDFVRTGRYVEICKDNFSTYSVQYTRLLLATCSEVDVVAKVLCEAVDPNAPKKNIGDYRTIILGKYYRFPEMKIRVPGIPDHVHPWFEWADEKLKAPEWWSKHNKVKHQRSEYYGHANLENVVLSLAGLFAITLLLYQETHELSPMRIRLDTGFLQYVSHGFNVRRTDTQGEEED